MKKSVGNAVIRNKIKRKLKYAVQKISKEKAINRLKLHLCNFWKKIMYIKINLQTSLMK